YAPRLPPTITKVKFTPNHAAPDQEIQVEADVKSKEELGAVELRYRVAGSGFEKQEQAAPMTKAAKNRYTAKVPAQKAGQIVRFRIKAMDAQGTARFYPPESEVRPALSVYVHDAFKPTVTPFGLIINVGQQEFQAARGGNALPTPVRGTGKSAFVYVDQKTGEPELF